MENHQYRQGKRLLKITDQIQYPHLMGDIEMRGGLVHYQKRGFLGKGSGNGGQLPLPPADLTHLGVGHLGKPGQRNVFLGQFQILLGLKKLVFLKKGKSP